MPGYVLLLEVDGRPSVPHHTVLFSHDYRREFAAAEPDTTPDE